MRDEDTDLFRRGEIKRVEPETYGFSTKENLYGEQGDDLMYGGNVYGTQTMHGGSGDDKVVAGWNIGSVYLYGNSGRDVVRSDQYDIVPRDCGEYDEECDFSEADYDEYLFGDYKYGTDALDKDLWGDADRIYGRSLACYE